MMKQFISLQSFAERETSNQQPSLVGCSRETRGIRCAQRAAVCFVDVSYEQHLNEHANVHTTYLCTRCTRGRPHRARRRDGAANTMVMIDVEFAGASGLPLHTVSYGSDQPWIYL